MHRKMHLAMSNESPIEAVVYHRRVMGHFSGQGSVEQCMIICKFPSTGH